MKLRETRRDGLISRRRNDDDDDLGFALFSFLREKESIITAPLPVVGPRPTFDQLTAYETGIVFDVPPPTGRTITRRHL